VTASPGGGARRVLVTGAAGRLGSAFAREVGECYDLRLTDLPGSDLNELVAHGELVEADLADLDSVRRLCQGIDTVVKLAASTDSPATWSQLLPANLSPPTTR